MPAPAGGTTRVFVSGVASVSHLVHAAAYVRDLLADPRTGRVVVTVLGLRGFLAARVTPQDVVDRLPADPRVSVEHATAPEHWRGAAGEDLVYLAVGAPGIKPYLRLVTANRRRLRCVVVDEGLGSYGDWRARWAAGRREGGRPVRALVRALAVSAAQRRLTDDRRALYRRTDSGWALDERVAAEFRRQVVARRAPDGAARQAVLVSQPWVELGQLDAERYRHVLQQVQEACSTAGLSLRVRPHPAEDRTRFGGFALDEGTAPVELDRSALAAAVVLGFNSTAVVNLAALHGVPVVRLALPELADVQARMSPDQRSLLDAFTPGAVPPDRLAERLVAVLGPAERRGES